jgi:hypothetical protein
MSTEDTTFQKVRILQDIYPTVKTSLQDLNGTSIPLSTYGDFSAIEPVPAAHLSFSYNINPRLSTAVAGNGGTVGNGNGHANLATGTAADGFAFILSRDVVKSNPGQGGLFRGDYVFETGGAADSEQLFGIGSPLDGFFFGYDGADFGVNLKGHGTLEVQALTVTVASTTDESVTITLDGESTTVAVTNSGDACKTAQEIGEGNYFSVGEGWGATAHGDQVEFISIFSGARPGTYSLTNSTTATGTFAQEVAGSLPTTDTWVAQTDWNVDKMDGTGPSGMTLDPAKGNVYEIHYQGGYGSITFSIEDSENGHFQLVHEIHYTNANTDISVQDPTFGLWASVRNFGSTIDVGGKTPQMGGFNEGIDKNFGPSLSEDNSGLHGNNILEEPILTIRNKRVFSGRLSRVRIKPRLITIDSNMQLANTTCTFRVYIDAYGLGACSYTDVSTLGSVVEVDKTSTSQDITEAEKVLTFILSATDSHDINVDDLLELVPPGLNMMITAQPSKAGTTNERGATINWKELF